MVTYTYDAWGNTLSTTGTLATTLGQYNPLRYRSYVYDQETGLYYLQSRYYNPEIGRFINADILICTGQGLLGNNMFAYCGNNPVSRIDPMGMCYYNADGEWSHDNWEYIDGYERKSEPQYTSSKKNGEWKSRKDPRKGSDQRQPSGSRERNVGHPEGEEHSRVPKGNPGARRMEGTVGLLISTVTIVWLVANDITGVGAADDAALVPAITAWLESVSSLF